MMILIGGNRDRIGKLVFEANHTNFYKTKHTRITMQEKKKAINIPAVRWQTDFPSLVGKKIKVKK